MLDTGIDIPEVVNLVFFKRVRSKSKFWQMVGRGTRLRPNLFGPGQDKFDFRIIDFCGNLEFFAADPETVDGRVAPSLTERLFAARLDVLAGLDAQGAHDSAGPVGDGTSTEAGLRIELAHGLHATVAGMTVHNVLVRPHRRWVERYSSTESWQRISPADAEEISEHLAGLPSAVRDDDEHAKRFDLLVLRLQLCVLNGEPGFERWRDRVREIASALLEKTNIPGIRAQQELLDAVAGDEWWIDVTLPMLELLRRRVRTLVRLMTKVERKTFYTDFEDQLGESTEVDLSGTPVGIDMARFEAKARVYLKAHEDHVALQKLRRNRPLTSSDLDELQRMLGESGVGTADELQRAADAANGLGLFIRGLVGLDRDAATDALSTFITGRTLTAQQLDFVNLVITYLTEHGAIEVGRLYEPPFTDHAPSGLESLFSGADIDALVLALDQVRSSASPEVA